MTRIPMSAAASGLLRGLLCRAGVPRHKILLTRLHSVEWQSLTFVGERHEIGLRVPPPRAAEIATRLTGGLDEAEFEIRGQIVADIAMAGGLKHEDDGSVTIDIEALTIAE